MLMLATLGAAPVRFNGELPDGVGIGYLNENYM